MLLTAWFVLFAFFVLPKETFHLVINSMFSHLPLKSQTEQGQLAEKGGEGLTKSYTSQEIPAQFHTTVSLTQFPSITSFIHYTSNYNNYNEVQTQHKYPKCVQNK